MYTQPGAVGTNAPEFFLKDQTGKETLLQEILKQGPALLAFYPGDFTPVCTKQLCNYKDNLESFKQYGVQIIGISSNTVEEHARFAEKYSFSFPLLADPGKQTAKAYGCTSLIMLGGISRAVFIVGSNGKILYRYVEPTVLSRRRADELVQILRDLKMKGMI